ncbi:MAG: permease, partial [Pseudomonadota bacterium]
MTELTPSVPSRTGVVLQQLWTNEKVWLVSASILILLLIFTPALGLTTIGFIIQNLTNIAPFLALSIGIAAYAGATGADGLIARAFTGSPIVMILLAAVVGGLSP